jgi:hypothetical protein
MDVPYAGELTGLVAVLWPIFRVIAHNLPNPHSNVREDIERLDARIGKLEGSNESKWEAIRLHERRLGDVELDIAALKRSRRSYD